jgi:hypothetical protein
VELTDTLEVGVLAWVVGAAVTDTVEEVQDVTLALGHTEIVRDTDPDTDTLRVPVTLPE